MLTHELPLVHHTYCTRLEMIEWLVDLLDGHEGLSEYTIEYAVALLMNLGLRTSGKKRCIKRATQILRKHVSVCVINNGKMTLPG